MSDDRYAAPAAALEHVGAEGESSAPRKPKAVFALQVLVGVAALALATGSILILLMQRRSWIGRIVGLVLVLLTAIPSVSGLLAQGDDPTLAYRVGWNGTLLLFLSLTGTWAYCFGLSRVAREYWRGSVRPTDSMPQIDVSRQEP
jgi:hypothetical protein